MYTHALPSGPTGSTARPVPSTTGPHSPRALPVLLSNARIRARRSSTYTSPWGPTATSPGSSSAPASAAGHTPARGTPVPFPTA